MEPGINFLALITFIFTLGYKIGSSSNKELKEMIDKFISFLQTNADKAKALINEFLVETEGMSSEEIKANIEKIMTKAVKKIDKIK